MVFYAAFNSISVISRRQLTLFMSSWVSPVLGWALKCLAQGHSHEKTQRIQCGSNPGPRDYESNTLPLSHVGPVFKSVRLKYTYWYMKYTNVQDDNGQSLIPPSFKTNPFVHIAWNYSVHISDALVKGIRTIPRTTTPRDNCLPPRQFFRNKCTHRTIPPPPRTTTPSKLPPPPNNCPRQGWFVMVRVCVVRGWELSQCRIIFPGTVVLRRQMSAGGGEGSCPDGNCPG